MIRQTVISKTQSQIPYSLEPFIREQLKHKGWYGDFYEAYDPDPETIDILAARAGATMGMEICEGVETERFNIPAGNHWIPAEKYYTDPQSNTIILFLHGGGFTVGSVAHKRAQCRYLALTSGAVVISAEYRLAPEAMYPAGKEDAVAALQYCVSLPHTRLALGGDSAGACLAANAILESGVKTDFAFFWYGAFDLNLAEKMEPTFDYESFTVTADDRDLVYNRLNRFRKLAVEMQKMYLPANLSPKDPAVSPMYSGQLSLFPPSLIIEAEYDYYRFCNEAFAAKLDQAGVPTEILFYEGVDHGFLDRIGSVPQAKHSIDVIAERIRTL